MYSKQNIYRDEQNCFSFRQIRTHSDRLVLQRSKTIFALPARGFYLIATLRVNVMANGRVFNVVLQMCYISRLIATNWSFPFD